MITDGRTNSTTGDSASADYDAPKTLSEPPVARFSSGDSRRPLEDHLERRRVASSRTFYGAAVALTISIVLPWAVVLGLAGFHVSGGAVVYLLLFAGVYAGEGHLVRSREVTRAMLIGAWIVNAWMVLNVVAIFSAFGNGGGVVSPGSGLYVASIGVVAGIAATVQLQRSRPRTRDGR